MLVIRMQRVGRKGHAQFRVVVQDSRRTPTSGKIVAALGHYNPHTKETKIDAERASHFVEHGAQPTSRVALLLKEHGVKLPSWVKIEQGKKRAIKNTDKLRRNRPVEEAPEVEAPAEEAPVVEAEEAPAEVAESAETAATEEPESPAEEAK
ncbi:MAG: 30S ribosomal protein S16 [bacterium]|nr:30S ribosomal protein S16 [bacterium]